MSLNDSGDGAPLGFFSDSEDLAGAAYMRCSNCGTSLLDLYKDGRMGCSECYMTFRSTVHRALIVLHGAHAHVGKTLTEDRE